jgi:hypothetical protein
MKYMKDFNGFLNENSGMNEGAENEMQAQQELVKSLQKASPSDIQKLMQSAHELASEHGVDVEELADPRVAVELLLKNAAANKVTESLDEGFTDWLANARVGLKKLAIRLGIYGGGAAAIASFLGMVGAGTMAGYDPTSPGYKGTTWPWFQELCRSIYPQADGVSNTEYRGVIASVLTIAMFVSAGVFMYSLASKGTWDDKSYGKF